MQGKNNFVAECDLFLKYLQINIKEVSREYARVEMPLLEHHRNGMGALHGGVICALADAAFGAAANHNSEFAVVTLSTSINYLRPGLTGPFCAEAKLTHDGNKILNYEVSIYDALKEMIAQGLISGFISNKLLINCN